MAFLLAPLSACVHPGAKPVASAHPLAGKIWDVAHSRMIAKDALLRELASAPFVLLGEVHDNPVHHQLQADVLQAVIAAGLRPALAMEQLDREHQSAVDAAAAAAGATADSVADAGVVDRKGWAWNFYAPLMKLALDARLPVVAMNLSRDGARNVARQGFTSLGASAPADLALDRTWNPVRQKVMEREIDDGHCGQLPPSALPRMIDMQRARDATMADALVTRAPQGAVVIAGAGHVRTDIGIPVYLAARMPGKRVIAIGFVEIDAERRNVGDYAPTPTAPPPYDYAWFTPAAEREDPCAGFTMPTRPAPAPAPDRSSSPRAG